jgi:hypothetical protein
MLEGKNMANLKYDKEGGLAEMKATERFDRGNLEDAGYYARTFSGKYSHRVVNGGVEAARNCKFEIKPNWGNQDSQRSLSGAGEFATRGLSQPR